MPPGKNLSSAHRVLAKRTSGSIKRTDSALDPPASFQPDFLRSPGSIMKVSRAPSLQIHNILRVSTHLTGKRSCWQDCLVFQGPAHHFSETSAEVALISLLWKLHLLDRSLWQPLIPGTLFSAAPYLRLLLSLTKKSSQSTLFTVALLPQDDS